MCVCAAICLCVGLTGEFLCVTHTVCITPYSNGLQQLLPGILHRVGEDLILHPIVVHLLPRYIHNVPHNLAHNLLVPLLSQVTEPAQWQDGEKVIW